MKMAAQHNKTRRPSKGQRLGWSPLKSDGAVHLTITADMVRGRNIPESEIRNRQNMQDHKTSLLIP